MHQDTAKAAQTHRPQHILVVDDNRDVLDVITEMLRQRGDRVSGAIGGESMRAILAAGDPVDAVILCEPVGAAAFRKLLANRPIRSSAGP
jgi:CheY-like chemotaxis protein